MELIKIAKTEEIEKEKIKDFGSYREVQDTIESELTNPLDVYRFLTNSKDIYMKMKSDQYFQKSFLENGKPNKNYFLRLLQLQKLGLDINPESQDLYYFVKGTQFGAITPKGFINIFGKNGFLLQLQDIKQNDKTEIDLSSLQASIKPQFPRGDLVAILGIVREMGSLRTITMELAEKTDWGSAKEMSIKTAEKKGSTSVWSSWEGEMAKKFVIRRLAKRLPNNNLNMAISLDLKEWEEEKKEINNLRGSFNNNFLKLGEKND